MEIIRVAGGPGGDSYLLLGRDKTALWDCGMAYCHEALVENVRQGLAGRPLDLVLLSHSHYDHVGGLPYLRRAFPELTCLAGGHAAQVFRRPNAQALIRELSESAAREFGVRDFSAGWAPEELSADGALADGDLVDLGGATLRVLDTPGHTRDSITFFCPEESLLLPAETLGVLLPDGSFSACYLTGYGDSLRSIRRCAALHAQQVICLHYGFVPEDLARDYCGRALAGTMETQEFLRAHIAKGEDDQTILHAYDLAFRTADVRREQPWPAFEINTRHMIHVIRREFFPEAGQA